MPTLLAIESSCDDTSAAVIRDGTVLSNVTAGQAVHVQYGGVVPEHAGRAHLVNIVPTVAAALERAGVARTEIEAVAFTRGPGLIGSLMVGLNFAKSFALARRLPLVAVDHLRAHVLAHFAEPPYPAFPFLCLTVSGGHTQIVLVRDYLDQEILGRTIDDAAGEAFDKSGKLLGLDYPAGPAIDRLAGTGQPTIEFAKPRIDGLDFSFSGLKTSILYTLEKLERAEAGYVQANLADVCASIQQSIVAILLEKLVQTAEETGIRQIAIGGGVSANSGLRAALAATGRDLGWTTYTTRLEYCTDNAAMIGITGYYQYLAGDFVDQTVVATARGGEQ